MSEEEIATDEEVKLEQPAPESAKESSETPTEQTEGETVEGGGASVDPEPDEALDVYWSLLYEEAFLTELAELCDLVETLRRKVGERVRVVKASLNTNNNQRKITNAWLSFSELMGKGYKKDSDVCIPSDLYDDVEASVATLYEAIGELGAPPEDIPPVVMTNKELGETLVIINQLVMRAFGAAEHIVSLHKTEGREPIDHLVNINRSYGLD